MNSRTGVLLVALSVATASCTDSVIETTPTQPASETSAPQQTSDVPLVTAVNSTLAPIPPMSTFVSTTEPGSELIQSWTLTPSDAENRESLRYRLAPGSGVEDAVVLYNLGNQRLDFRLYATDAFNNLDGQFDLLPASEAPVDVGSWVQVAQSTVSLDPQNQATIPITITVPLDAVPGDHSGAILASSESILDTGEPFERRTGSRLYVRVAGPLVGEAALVDLRAGYRPSATSATAAGSVDIRVTIQNRGNVRLSTTYAASVTDAAGAAIGQAAPVTIAELLPGQQVDVSITIEDVPATVTNAVVSLAASDPEGEISVLPVDQTVPVLPGF